MQITEFIFYIQLINIVLNFLRQFVRHKQNRMYGYLHKREANEVFFSIPMFDMLIF